MQFSIVDVASVFLSVNHYPREFNTTQKKKTRTSWAQHDKTLEETIAFPNKRKSLLVIQLDPGATLENKLNDLKPLYTRMKSFAFQKK